MAAIAPGSRVEVWCCGLNSRCAGHQIGCSPACGFVVTCTRVAVECCALGGGCTWRRMEWRVGGDLGGAAARLHPHHRSATGKSEGVQGQKKGQKRCVGLCQPVYQHRWRVWGARHEESRDVTARGRRRSSAATCSTAPCLCSRAVHAPEHNIHGMISLTACMAPLHCITPALQATHSVWMSGLLG